MQVVVNLLSNAIKFSPKGGRVALRVERIRGVVEVRTRAVASPRLPAGVIFEPFRQVQSDDARVRGGTGRPVDLPGHRGALHGGSIGVEPRDEPGATFWFALPAAPDLARA
ncbi:MAG: ATP-binding protein [Vicinamibacteria bacterium]